MASSQYEPYTLGNLGAPRIECLTLQVFKLCMMNLALRCIEAYSIWLSGCRSPPKGFRRIPVDPRCLKSASCCRLHVFDKTRLRRRARGFSNVVGPIRAAPATQGGPVRSPTHHALGLLMGSEKRVRHAGETWCQCTAIATACPG